MSRLASLSSTAVFLDPITGTPTTKSRGLTHVTNLDVVAELPVIRLTFEAEDDSVIWDPPTGVYLDRSLGVGVLIVYMREDITYTRMMLRLDNHGAVWPYLAGDLLKVFRLYPLPEVTEYLRDRIPLICGPMYSFSLPDGVILSPDR